MVVIVRIELTLDSVWSWCTTVMLHHQCGGWEWESNSHYAAYTSPFLTNWNIPTHGQKYEDRTHDSGITTRGFTTKLTSAYYHIETLLFGFEPCSSIVYLRFPQCWQECFYMVRVGGFEPTTNRLKVYCSTNWAILALCCLRKALLLLRWTPALRCKAKTTKRLRCLTIILCFITAPC